ncbi:Type 1 glutamine amidotransferase-like domain-containing protein [Phenylobacterium sp.]|uniref:Type 1 glutamine amidotransferase-like domain-containing protein n=1 Tax=Phenylobacterium sp. TaxID=1871053 RepID=UPI002FCC8146
MRLYLASYRTDTVQPLLDLAGPGARAAVVSNALDLIPDTDRRAYAARVHDPVADLRDAGMAAEPLDLRGYFGKPAELDRALAGVGLVWAVGGNAFLLRRAMAQSGLDQILTRRLAEDSLVYGGWSAGACVAGATLRGLHLMDDPDPVAPGYDPAPIWEGLGLVDFAIVPHFASAHAESEAATRAAAWMTGEGIAHRTLRDGEAVMRRGDW